MTNKTPSRLFRPFSSAALVALAFSAVSLPAQNSTKNDDRLWRPAPDDVSLFVQSPAKNDTKPPAVFGCDPAALESLRAAVAAKDPAIKPAFDALIQAADKVLPMKPVSVMDKKVVADSGDKHDYFSLAPYWWPDPAKPDGLPYIRHDGKRNPESRRENDADVFPGVCNNIERLGLAYYLTGNEAYAAKAAQLATVWFLDPATRMNPNLNYAQAVRGHNNGRGIGLIESRHLCALTDGLALIAGSTAWPAASRDAMRAWLDSYYKWLVTSKNGTDESGEKNNHGSWYAVQAAHLELVLGKTDAARQRIESKLPALIASQIMPDGSQPLELARTKSLNYSLFNLEALFALAQLGDRAGYTKGWTYATSDGRSLRAALAFVAPYLDTSKKWIKDDIETTSRGRILPLLCEYLAHQDDAEFAALYKKFAHAPSPQTERWILILEGVAEK